jgi:UDP-N-acetylmuramoyl-L-alanyl-D-glutamate--2,6-diaminopimelate ligase
LLQMLVEAVQNRSKTPPVEMTSHTWELKRTYGLEIDAAMFTNLCPEHLDLHGNLDRYFSATKSFHEVNGERLKHCVRNIDDLYRVSHGALASAPLFTGMGIQ